VRTTAELREGFLSYFEEKGHKRLPSWPLIPRPDDHTTLLTSAGMQPQMPFFLGREEPPAPLTTTSQKCFRTQDIDEVGLDGHHLTFFEMLGNFSFGQYFKDGAIAFATEFIQERLQLDWDRGDRFVSVLVAADGSLEQRHGTSHRGAISPGGVAALLHWLVES
jgi:alanyl-tRNA synthetase